MSTLFNYPSQTVPVKMGLVNVRVRRAKLAKREKGKKRREKSAGERSSPRDRSHFRGEETRGERERDRGRERKRERKKEGEGERRTPLVTKIISVARGIALARAKEKGRREACASPPDSPHDGILFRCERETFAEEERKRRKRE